MKALANDIGIDVSSEEYIALRNIIFNLMHLIKYGVKFSLLISMLKSAHEIDYAKSEEIIETITEHEHLSKVFFKLKSFYIKHISIKVKIRMYILAVLASLLKPFIRLRK